MESVELVESVETVERLPPIPPIPPVPQNRLDASQLFSYWYHKDGMMNFGWTGDIDKHILKHRLSHGHTHKETLSHTHTHIQTQKDLQTMPF